MEEYKYIALDILAAQLIELHGTAKKIKYSFRERRKHTEIILSDHKEKYGTHDFIENILEFCRIAKDAPTAKESMYLSDKIVDFINKY